MILDKIAFWMADNIVNGSTLVSVELKEKRKDICLGRNGFETCDKYVKNEENERYSKCGACSCFIEIKTASDTHVLEGLKNGKVKREKVICPIGKWEKLINDLEQVA